MLDVSVTVLSKRLICWVGCLEIRFSIIDGRGDERRKKTRRGARREEREKGEVLSVYGFVDVPAMAIMGMDEISSAAQSISS